MATTIATTVTITINTKACTFVGLGNRTLILAVSLASVVVLRRLSVVGNCGCARCLRTYSRHELFGLSNLPTLTPTLGYGGVVRLSHHYLRQLHEGQSIFHSFTSKRDTGIPCQFTQPLPTLWLIG